MRTEPYSKYLSRMAALSGVDSLQLVEEQQFLEYFQSNIRRAWEMFEWPELCPVEERIPDDSGVIPFACTGETEIGEVFAVYPQDPRQTPPPCDIDFYLTPDGLQLIGGITSPVWVYFRRRVPDYSGDPYNNLTAYTDGQQAYYPQTGRFYKAITGTTGNPPTDEAYWEEIPVPYALFEYVVRAAFADSLLAEGFTEKSSQQRDRAEAWITQEIDKVTRQQRQHWRRSVVRTHGTTQTRWR